MQDCVGLLIAFVLGFFMKTLMGTVCESRLVEGDDSNEVLWWQFCDVDEFDLNAAQQCRDNYWRGTVTAGWQDMDCSQIRKYLSEDDNCLNNTIGTLEVTCTDACWDGYYCVDGVCVPP